MTPSANGDSLIKATIIENVCLNEKYYRISFEVPEGYLKSHPGQFVMLRVGLRPDPLLGRPFSIYSVYRFDRSVACSILYRVVGKMTDLLSRKAPGECVYVLGPLGRGFDLSSNFSRAILVGGGTGIAPISFLSETLRSIGKEIIFYYGAKSELDLIELANLEAAGFPRDSLNICTEDCSRGEQGVVTTLLTRDIDLFNPGESSIFACGPMPMLRSLRDVLASRSIPAQISIEERMACGMGVCLACAVPLGGSYVRACQEGPVFNLRKVELGC